MNLGPTELFILVVLILGVLLLVAIRYGVVFLIRRSQDSPDRAKEAQPAGAAQLKKCPFCGEQNRIDAKICRFCGRDLPTEESG